VQRITGDNKYEEAKTKTTNAVRNVRTASLPGMAASIPQAITTRVRLHEGGDSMIALFITIVAAIVVGAFIIACAIGAWQLLSWVLSRIFQG
jgi:hypothetical protein